MNVEAEGSERHESAPITGETNEPSGARRVLNGYDLAVSPHVGRGQPRSSRQPNLRAIPLHVEIRPDVIWIDVIRLRKQEPAVGHPYVRTEPIPPAEILFATGQRDLVCSRHLARLVAAVSERAVAEPARKKRQVSGTRQLSPARHHFLGRADFTHDGIPPLPPSGLKRDSERAA